MNVNYYLLARDFEIDAQMRPAKDHQKWGTVKEWVYLQINLDGTTFGYTPDKNVATPFKTKEEADRMAFSIVMMNPNLMHKVKVELR